jgi:hypothetical protein
LQAVEVQADMRGFGRGARQRDRAVERHARVVGAAELLQEGACG